MTPFKILIIDDEADHCIIIKSYFERKNYQVFVGSTIREGMDTLAQCRPDILLLDNNLPDGKGWELLDSIVTEYPSMKIHLISAYHTRKDPLPVHENVTVWEKPISLNALDKAFAR